MKDKKLENKEVAAEKVTSTPEFDSKETKSDDAPKTELNESTEQSDETDSVQVENDVTKQDSTESDADTETKKVKKTKKKKKKSKFSKIISAIEWIILFACIGLFVYTFTCTARGKAVTIFGKSLLYVVTGSMEPTIHVGEYVIVQSVPVESLEYGDIIAFYTENEEIKGKLVIHRIIEVRDDGTFIVMGDANPVPDEIPIKPENIIGKFERKSILFNWMASFTDPRKLLLLLVVIPVFLLSIYEAATVVNVMKKVRKEKEEEDRAEGKVEEKTGKVVGLIDETQEQMIERLKREAIEAYLKGEGTSKEEDSEQKEEG
ncbi:MAG: signal peptidase I [Eubacterium sp.]|nr:signal peptidase I [Eubacterium sp.]